MAINNGYIFENEDTIYRQLVCSCCGKYLGVYYMINGKEYAEIKGWKFCPYCGTSL